MGVSTVCIVSSGYDKKLLEYGDRIRRSARRGVARGGSDTLCFQSESVERRTRGDVNRVPDAQIGKCDRLTTLLYLRPCRNGNFITVTPVEKDELARGKIDPPHFTCRAPPRGKILRFNRLTPRRSL